MKMISMILAVLLSGVFTLSAQKLANDGLVLTGSVQRIETECLAGKPIMRVGLYMQFRNDSNVPLFMIGPSPVFTRRVHFIGDKLGEPPVSGGVVQYNPYLDNPFGPATADDYDPFQGFLDRLIAGQRPREISPGRYVEFRDTVWLNSGFRIDIREGTTQKECEESKANPIPEHPSFVLEYHLSMKKYDHGTGILKTLNDRWKQFGNLVHDSNGDVSYKSETIVLQISERN